MTEPLGLALLGCGTVGSGVARLLLEQSERLTARSGRPLVLRRLVVRDPDKMRGVDISRDLITTDLHSVLNDPAISVVVELVGGVDWARRAVLDCLKAGKHIVTANKALLAHYGAEVFDTARHHGRAVAFEASVAGGIPIIAALSQGLAANQIVGLQGILNGTCNFILTSMCEQGLTYAEALAEAQQRGYAEADPTLDVNGTDATHKLAILAQIAFGITAPVATIDRRGITDIDIIDIHSTGSMGYSIKLLAEAWLDTASDSQNDGRQVALRVSPVLLPWKTPLRQVGGAYNAISVMGDVVGNTFYYGPGAGQMPTASAVVADIIDVAIGRAQRTFQTMHLWSGDNLGVTLCPADNVRSRFYLRFETADRPGVLADVVRELARQQIGTTSISQHEVGSDCKKTALALVIMTRHTSTGNVQKAVAEINRLDGLVSPGVYYPVMDSSE